MGLWGGHFIHFYIKGQTQVILEKAQEHKGKEAGDR